MHRSTLQTALEGLLAFSATAFLLYLMPWHDLLAPSVTAGGDMASHYYPSKLMHEELLPSGRITGWTMGNYAGFPIFHFYSTLPFVLIALLGYVAPMEQAFKIVTLLGPLTLPLAAAYCFRTLGYSRGGAVLAAASTLPFLFQQGNSMWGGNIPSVLAGEFCHAIGLSLMLVFMGTLHRAAHENRSWLWPAVVLAAIGLSHAFSFIAAVWASLFYLWPRKGMDAWAPVLPPVYLLAFLLLCFWGLPLPPRLQFTTEYSMIWRIGSWKEVVPELLWPAGTLMLANFALMMPVRVAMRMPARIGTGLFSAATATALLVYRQVILTWLAGGIPSAAPWVWACAFFVSATTLVVVLPRKPFVTRRDGLLLFVLVGSVFLYLIAPFAGFPDIRFIPVTQIFIGLIAADLLCWSSSSLNYKLLFSSVVMLACMAWSHQHLGYLPAWLTWNYAGYEGKPTWQTFKAINDHIAGDLNDPRAIFEHSQTHNRFGSSRAFENIPLFSGRPTLEGVFHQVSPNSPFVFYIQSEVSEKTSGPFPQYTYARLNPDAALPHLRVYNVSSIVAVSKKAREAYDEHPAFTRSFWQDGYAVYDIEGTTTGYVVPAQFEPVLYEGNDFKLAFYRWFKNASDLDVPLVAGEHTSETEARAFTYRTTNALNLSRTPYPAECTVESHIEQYRVSFETNCPGRPHIIKVSYFPRWKSHDGSPVHYVAPGFMLVYPSERHFELLYQRTALDWTALGLTWLGLLLAVTSASSRRFHQGAVSLSRALFGGLFFGMSRWSLPLGILLAVVFASLGASARMQHTEPELGYRLGQAAYRNRDFEGAIRLFEEWTSTDRDTFKHATALYQLGVSHSESDHHAAAVEVLERLRAHFPNVNYGAGSLFHLALNYAALDMESQARQAAHTLQEKFPETSWAKRLPREHPELDPAVD